MELPSRETVEAVMPFLIAWSFLGGVSIVVGRKKGVSIPVAILGSFPLWVAFFTFWLLRQPDVRNDDEQPRR